MSPAEIGWRAHAAVRGIVDRVRFAANRPPALASPGAGMDHIDAGPAFRIAGLRREEWAGIATDEPEWLARLVAQADDAADHRLSYFNLQRQFVGDPVDWHRDHESGRATPRGYSRSIDYRDHDVAGDCKLVWEPNRHHQFVVLARAYSVTGQVRYAQALVNQLESWLDQNPFWTGMNWRSGLELGIRLINWIWSLELIAESGQVAPALYRRVAESAYLHCWEIRRNYSRGSSANNHLIGEAAGVFVASAYFAQFPQAAAWRLESRRILEREVRLQTHGDGCTREHALGYQLFVLEFFLICGIVARRIGEDFSKDYWACVEKMIEFLARMSEGGGSLPLFGDCDDGYVLDLGRTPADPRDLFCIGAVLFGREDFRARAGAFREPALWLCERGARARFDSVPQPPRGAALGGRAFPESGYYLLQCGSDGMRNRISVLFDCAPLGFGAIAAHGHADALSFTLRAFDADVLVDPGTYDYFTFPEWRTHFRSTAAHNTLAVDDTDQSVMHGLFMWGSRARARCTHWQADAERIVVSAEHDGYMRLSDPVRHGRTLELDCATRTLVVTDRVSAKGAHRVALGFQLAEHCAAEQTSGGVVIIRVAGEHIVMTFDPRLDVKLVKGSVAPIAGWVSRGYHRKNPATSIIARARTHGDATFVTRVEVPSPRQ